MMDRRGEVPLSQGSPKEGLSEKRMCIVLDGRVVTLRFPKKADDYIMAEIKKMIIFGHASQ
jgi:hypothetical protein